MNEMTEVYVAPWGSDRGSGSKAHPLGTLECARDLLREKGAGRGKARVWLRGGRHVLRRPLVLTAADSGVTFIGVPGEEAIIDGGEAITGWREVRQKGRTEFVTAVERYGRQLFVNGERRLRPRIPKLGRDVRRATFLRIEDVPGGKREEFELFEHYNRFVAREGEFQGWSNLRDVEVVVLHFWVDERLPVESFDATSRVVTTRMKSMYALTDGWSGEWARYYVENVCEALSEPGEWYLERKSGVVRYLPKVGETVETIDAWMPRLRELVRICDGAENVEFIGVAFEHTEWEHRGGRRANVNDPVLAQARFGGHGQAAWGVAAAVTLEGAKNCVFEECHFRHLGGYAVEIGKGCDRVVVKRCTLCDLGAGGIRINGARAEEARGQRSGRHVIADNEICSIGHVFHAGVGILAMHTYGNTITGNHLHDLLYSGISCGWVWGFGENVARDNVIKGNHIHDLGKGWLSDMGGIYTLGVQPGTIISENRVHEVRAVEYGGWGIYLDEGSSHIVVEGNLVYDCGSTALNVHFGRENIVRRNVFAFGGEGVVGLGRREEGNAFTLERNVLITEEAPIYRGGYGWDVTDHGMEADLNVLWSVKRGADLTVAENARHRSVGTGLDMVHWRALGQDRHSWVADPRCKDLTGRDFRLHDDSPARELGIELTIAR